METEILLELSECIALCRKLDALLEEDKEEMAHCISGEVYDEYVITIRETKKVVSKFKNRLSSLYDEQMIVI